MGDFPHTGFSALTCPLCQGLRGEPALTHRGWRWDCWKPPEALSTLWQGCHKSKLPREEARIWRVWRWEHQSTCPTASIPVQETPIRKQRPTWEQQVPPAQGQGVQRRRRGIVLGRRAPPCGQHTAGSPTCARPARLCGWLPRHSLARTLLLILVGPAERPGPGQIVTTPKPDMAGLRHSVCPVTFSVRLFFSGLRTLLPL